MLQLIAKDLADVGEFGTPVDGEGDPDWWYQVPAMIATGGNRSTSMPSPASNDDKRMTRGAEEGRATDGRRCSS
jgi:hypothetical protein